MQKSMCFEIEATHSINRQSKKKMNKHMRRRLIGLGKPNKMIKKDIKGATRRPITFPTKESTKKK